MRGPDFTCAGVSGWRCRLYSPLNTVGLGYWRRLGAFFVTPDLAEHLSMRVNKSGIGVVEIHLVCVEAWNSLNVIFDNNNNNNNNYWYDQSIERGKQVVRKV